MTHNQCKTSRINLQEIFGADRDSFKALWREVLREVLEQEMTDSLGAEERRAEPWAAGFRSGYYDRALVTRVGELELRIPQIGT
jgi:putative transposase